MVFVEYFLGSITGISTCCPILMAAARFCIGGTSPKAKASATSASTGATELSIAEIMTGNMPLRPVSCRGRIHAIYGVQQRWPVTKSLGAGEVGRSLGMVLQSKAKS